MHDTLFPPLIEVFQNRMVRLADTGFHATGGDPSNLKRCPRGTWNDRMLIETVYSMLTLISHLKKMRHRVADYLEARLAFNVIAFNLLVQGGWLEARSRWVHSLVHRRVQPVS